MQLLYEFGVCPFRPFLVSHIHMYPSMENNSIFKNMHLILDRFGTFLLLLYNIVYFVVVQLLGCGLTLCTPMDCSMPGSSVLYCRLEFAQIQVH